MTWDDDDPERNRITRRTLSRVEIEESDFKAFLASPSSDSESEAGLPGVPKTPGISKGNTSKVSRHKLRALLLGGDDELPEGWSRNTDEQGEVDMEITFTPGLSEKKNRDESTLDKYQRKAKEKRKRKKEEAKGKALGAKRHSLQDEFFDDGMESGNESNQTSEPSVSPKSAQQPQSLSEPAPRPLPTSDELKLLISSGTREAEHKHFNIKAIRKAEKDVVQKRKDRRKRGENDDNELQDDFSIDVKDDRFNALHDDHQYAIDPSNPQCVLPPHNLRAEYIYIYIHRFMKTKSMTALLEERSRRQKESYTLDTEDVPVRKPIGNAGRSLTGLVESVKRKSAILPIKGTGKRRKL